MAKIIAFGNRKGGVGKSTLTLLTATALSSSPFNKKVLVIDADDQQSLVRYRNEDVTENLEAELPYKIISCLGDINKLHDTLQRASTTHDYIFIDVAGRLDEFTKKVLFYVDVLGVPFQAGNFALESTFDYIQFALNVSQKRVANGMSDIKMIGFVNMYMKRRVHSKDIRESLETFQKHMKVMDNNLGFYSAFMDATTLETVYEKETKDTAKTNFINWLNEFIKIAQL